MALGPPRKGASQQEIADHLAKMVYQEIMSCRHFKVYWRTKDGLVTASNPLVLQPFAVPKTITIEIDGGAGPPPTETTQ